MKTGKKTGLPKRINISWTFWLLIVSPKSSFQRFLSINALPIALTTVSLGGLLEGIALSKRLDSFLGAILRILNFPIDHVFLLILLLAFFLINWFSISLIYRFICWLFELKATFYSLLVSTGISCFPWIMIKTMILPMSLVESSSSFGIIDDLATLIIFIWSFILHVVGLKASLQGPLKNVIGIILFTFSAITCISIVIFSIITYFFGRKIFFTFHP